jgi:hypothetical protein
MRLGKVLDLSKCYYDKDHWTHPDLKEGRLYLCRKLPIFGDEDDICIARCIDVSDEKKRIFIFQPTCTSGGEYLPFYSLASNPLGSWKHLQELIVDEEKELKPFSCGAEVDIDGYGGD